MIASSATVMRAFRFTLLWLALVALFSLFGWFSYKPWEGYTNPRAFYFNIRFENAVAWGAVGVGVASFVVAAFLVVSRSRERCRLSGLGMLLGAASLAPVVTFVLLCLVQIVTTDYAPMDEVGKGVHLFQGWDGWWLFMAPFYCFLIAAAASLFFFLCILDLKEQTARS